MQNSMSSSGPKIVINKPSKSINKFTDLTDVPHNYTGQAGSFVKVNDTEDGLEFSQVTPGEFNTDCIVTARATLQNNDFLTYGSVLVPLVVVDSLGNIITVRS